MKESTKEDLANHFGLELYADGSKTQRDTPHLWGAYLSGAFVQGVF